MGPRRSSPSRRAASAWTSPAPVRILTVSEKSQAHAESVRERLLAAGTRVHVDDRADKIGFKIREAHAAKIPWMAVIGEDEMEADTVALRLRTDLRGRGVPEKPSVDEFVQLVSAEALRPF